MRRLKDERHTTEGAPVSADCLQAERRAWEQIFTAIIHLRGISPKASAEIADTCLEIWRERWTEEV